MDYQAIYPSVFVLLTVFFFTIFPFVFGKVSWLGLISLPGYIRVRKCGRLF